MIKICQSVEFSSISHVQKEKDRNSLLAKLIQTMRSNGGGDGGGGSGVIIISHHRRSHNGTSTGGFVRTSSTVTPTNSSSSGSQFQLEVSRALKGIVMSRPTSKFVIYAHRTRNNANKTRGVYQIVATVYGLNNQTLGLDNATPTPDTLSLGQSGSFEHVGISDLNQMVEECDK